MAFSDWVFDSRWKIWRLNDINGVNEYITRGANKSTLKVYEL